MTFNELNLNTPLLNALDDLGISKPTTIQAKAYSVILSGKDVVGIAQTGTGKTFAYILPILKQLKFSNQKHPRVLVLVPTRELVIQVRDEFKKLASYMNIRVEGIYGGTNINTQKQLVYNGLDVLIATPGRLMDITLTGTLRLKNIQKLVIDEIDEMLDLGFLPQLEKVVDLLPAKRQNLMFSATLTQEVEKVVNKYFENAQKIEAAPHGTPVDNISQSAYFVPNFYTKANLLEYLLTNDDSLIKVLVFVSNKKIADRLFEILNEIFPDKIGVMHSNKSQNYRIRTVGNFQNGSCPVLIATDLIARGLDISEVSHVINFDTPAIPETYIHRIGRTGRADKEGISITFINEAEKAYQAEIETLMNREIPILDLPEEIEISDILTDDEKPKIPEKNYLKPVSKKKIAGQAFHEKKEKNKKKNSGSPSRKRDLAKIRKYGNKGRK